MLQGSTARTTLVIAYAVLGVPYYNYSKICLKTLFGVWSVGLS